MTAIDLGRPVSGDVVDLILDDHRRFEALLRVVAADPERTLSEFESRTDAERDRLRERDRAQVEAIRMRQRRRTGPLPRKTF